MKNNIDYYQHFTGADTHPKFKMLRAEYGWSGEGKFWALNNRIAMADSCKLNINKKYRLAALADDLGFDLAGIKQYIDFLVNDCELLQADGDYITNETLQENLSRVQLKRTRNQTYYRQRTDNSQQTETKIKQTEQIQSKVNKSKVKKTKVKTPCPELSKDSSEPPVLTIPLVGENGDFPIIQKNMDEWQEDFPGIDVLIELKKCRQWNISNPKNRKTPQGIRRHINSWLSRAQDNSRPSLYQKQPKSFQSQMRENSIETLSKTRLP